jgi:hypothetical protein
LKWDGVEWVIEELSPKEWLVEDILDMDQLRNKKIDRMRGDGRLEFSTQHRRGGTEL